MSTSSSNTALTVKPPTVEVIPTAPVKTQIGAGEFFLRFFVVAVGIVLGAIFSLYVGLATGWIQFC